jgi:hypothetical protein
VLGKASKHARLKAMNSTIYEPSFRIKQLERL